MKPEIIRIPPDHRSPSPAREIEFELLKTRGLRLECLVSYGTPSQPGFWYDQAAAEWVLLFRGNAILRFEEGDVELSAGDSLNIPAGTRHRVESVSADAVWLALHHDGAATDP
ncbi:MAG: cupin domain-containing protein [Akkermansiaceae bacterium]|nr:cupin domain-containing protein [Akkermansiaceae bacterium]